MAAQGGEREEKTAMRSPEETSRSGVPFGSRPRRASPYFQTLTVSDSQRPELASLSSREDLDHWGDQGYPKTMLTHTDDGTDVQPLVESAGGTAQDSGELSLAVAHGEPEGNPNEDVEPIGDVFFDCQETLSILLSEWKQRMSLSERYEEEMVVRAEALVNSGRRLVQSYEQEKIRLADELLHVHVLLSEECRDPRSHGRLDDVAAAEPPNHRLDGRPLTDRQPTGAHTE
ncbi:uncharacterized protein LOC133339601 [Lethenteron reissneri]|uniref:uncharacterized protein LOC133339601 n=1 Tax=Lethenteron reissneri TaxID=7753 RepID=UPI002AB7CE0D|nr:uncharacterized protein LOC133339601 [Lethenteron reissneri]